MLRSLPVERPHSLQGVEVIDERSFDTYMWARRVSDWEEETSIPERISLSSRDEPARCPNRCAADPRGAYGRCR
jgi:hypothetical protein